MAWHLLLVAVGGGAGSVTRYLVGLACQHFLGSGFGWGTLLVNAAGCLAIGFLLRQMLGPEGLSESARHLLMVGFLGGLTTFSAFGMEAFSLFSQGKGVLALGYVMATNVLGLVGVAVGWSLGR